jgi:predicted dienelactone hydrolase
MGEVASTVFGHSFGGSTALRVAAENRRIVAALSLAPGPTQSIVEDVDRIVVPTMVEAAEFDSFNLFENIQRDVYDHLRPPRYLVKSRDAGHFAFADVCPSGLQWLGADIDLPDCAPDRIPQDEAHALVLRFSVPFLERYVSGDHRFDAFLEPSNAPAGGDLVVNTSR